MKKSVAFCIAGLSLFAQHVRAENTFCLVEGAGSPSLSPYEIISSWSEVVETISSASKTKYVIQHFISFDSIEKVFKNKTCTVALVKPIQYAALAMRDSGYQMVTSIKGEFIGNFIVRANDTRMKAISDLGGKTIMLPDPKALQSLLAKRELKQLKIVPSPEIKHTRLQEVVLYAVEKGFVDAGFVNPTMAKVWAEKGGKVLYKTKPNPYWVIIASKEVSEKEIVAMREGLLKLERTDKGAASLAKIGIKGFESNDKTLYLKLLEDLNS